MASPKSVMSVSSIRAEISSEQGSPGSYIEHLSDSMECDMTDPYMELPYPDDTMKSLLSLNIDYMETMQRLAETKTEVARLEMLMAEHGVEASYSDLGLHHNFGRLSGCDRLSAGDFLYDEEDGEISGIDIEPDDTVPPSLEPTEAMSGIEVISSTTRGAAGNGKGRVIDNEAGKENMQGRVLDKGKGRARDKSKSKTTSRASPYLRSTPHLRTSLGLDFPSLFPRYLMNIPGCTDEAMSDLLGGLRNTHPALFPDDRFPSEPSGCGVPHHDDD